MLSQGFVREADLKAALHAQRDSGSGRVGEWLRHLGSVTELQVTRALGMQWSLPVFPLEKTQSHLECAGLVPFPILDAAQMVPVHFVPQARHLYVAFADRINYTVLYAVEKMLNCRTEPCLALQTEIQKVLGEIRQRPRPAEILLDSVSDPVAMARTLVSYAVKLAAEEVRAVGCGEFAWIKMHTRNDVNNLLFRVSNERQQTTAVTI